MTSTNFIKTKEFLEQAFNVKRIPNDIFLLDGRWGLVNNIIIPIFHDEFYVLLNENFIETGKDFEEGKIYFLYDVFEGIFFSDENKLLEVRLMHELSKLSKNYLVSISKTSKQINGVFIDPQVLVSSEYKMAKYILWNEKIDKCETMPTDKYIKQKLIYLLKLHNIDVDEDMFIRLRKCYAKVG